MYYCKKQASDNQKYRTVFKTPNNYNFKLFEN